MGSYSVSCVFMELFKNPRTTNLDVAWLFNLMYQKRHFLVHYLGLFSISVHEKY